jgi:hypothetical protein
MYGEYPHAVVELLLNWFPIGMVGLLPNVPQSVLPQVTVQL